MTREPKTRSNRAMIEAQISCETKDIVGKWVAEFQFRITPDARVTEAYIRELFAEGAENTIATIKERAPQVLVEDAP